MGALQNPDSRRQQFFICFDDASSSTGKSRSGGVIEGMENVDKDHARRAAPQSGQDPERAVGADAA